MTERWSVDAAGKMLRVDRTVNVAGQNFDVNLKFIKRSHMGLRDWSAIADLEFGGHASRDRRRPTAGG